MATKPTPTPDLPLMEAPSEAEGCVAAWQRVAKPRPLSNVRPINHSPVPSAAEVRARVMASGVEVPVREDGSWAVRVEVDGHAVTLLGGTTGPAIAMTPIWRRLVDLHGDKLVPGAVEPVRISHAQVEAATEQGWANAAEFLRSRAEVNGEAYSSAARELEQVQAGRAAAGNDSAAVHAQERAQ